MNKFTQEDLVQYLYKETNEKKTADINVALESEWTLQDSFEQLSDAMKILDEVHLSPRDETVTTILQNTTKKHSELHPH
jgi:hypothetical protein